MNRKVVERPHQFYSTALLPCPYIQGRMERKIITELSGLDAQLLHDMLSRAGFRRSHNIVYRPACPGCDSCVPVRIVTESFQPSRSQRKVLKENADLTMRDVPAMATPEQYAVFHRYQVSRHGNGEMSMMTFEDYRLMVEDSPIDTVIAEFRCPQGRLLGACLTDCLGDGLSAVYSFFDPEESPRSLGTHMVLSLVGRARERELPYVYLGYWIGESRKMSYKIKFQPLEGLGANGWQRLPDCEG